MITIELGPRCREVLLQREDAKEVFFVCVVMSFNDRVIRFLTMLFISKKQTEFFYDLTKVYFSYSYFDYWIHMSYNTDISYHRLRNHYRFWRSQNTVEGVSLGAFSNEQKDEFFNGLEDLGLCKTVEDFWQIYLSLPIVGTNNASRYYLFKVRRSISLIIVE